MNALEAREITKIYRLYRRPADRVLEILARRPFHRAFKALDRVSFEVRAGETLGVIGPNGAGKSTLLKILTGTLTPTSGSVARSGRTAAILELGAGFHPEFTGRRNIYVNGALMGLPERTVREKEDEIIAFSGLGEFIDRPVRTYSSGMVVRLAFSIATSLDPDILIVDEALSVGDQAFQAKCMERMLGFKERGKTILFCTHSLYHVTHLCEKALWLHQGRIRMLGPARRVAKAYEDWVRASEKGGTGLLDEERGGARLEIRLFSGGAERDSFSTGEPFEARISFEAPGPCHAAFGIKRNDELQVFVTSTQADGLDPLPPKGEVAVRVPELPLLAGRYTAVAAVLDKTGCVVLERRGAEFDVEKDGIDLGVVKIPHSWERLA